MKQKKTAVMGLMAAGALALGVQQAGAATNDVYNGIGVDTTWSAANVYRLMEPVFVTNGATLNIPAGTVIRGKNNGAGVAPGALIIARGAKIKAMGTAANPIVFTDENDDNVGGSSGTGDYASKANEITKKWGGLLLLGKTYIASNIGEPATPSPNAGLELQIEGITSYGEISKYGGGNDDDNSGELHYVSLRYGGFILGAANEINGLTMGAVGRGTAVDHVEIFHNADDDIEFFGGTVNTKYVVAWGSMDDGMDLDEGYRGKQQFMLRVKAALGPTQERSDKGSEEDGGMGYLSQPSTCAMWYNWTQIGLGKATDQKKDTGFMLRDGTGLRCYNSLWMDFGGAPALIEGSPTDGVAGDAADKFVENYVNNAYYTGEAIGLDGVQAKKGEIKYNVYWKFGTNAVPGYTIGAPNTITQWGTDTHNGVTATNHNWYAYPLFTDASLHNFYLPEGDGTGGTYLSPVSNLTRRTVGTTLTGEGKTYYNVDTLNPLPRPGYDTALMTYGRVPPNDGFYTPVNFIGAFGNTKNWALGWTLASRFGLLTGGVQGDYTGVVPGIRLNGANVEVKVDGDVYQGIPADMYVVFETTPGKYYILPTLNANAVLWNGAQVTAAAFPLPGTPGIGWTKVCSTANRPAGTTRSYFVVDMMPGNGVMDLAQVHYATIP